jgi:hypothetical protein
MPRASLDYSPPHPQGYFYSRRPSQGDPSRRQRNDTEPLNSLDWRVMKRERQARPKPPRQQNALETFRRTREWPPQGYSIHSRLSAQEAEDVICAGASTFKGFVEPVPNAPGCNKLYATMQFESAYRTDRMAAYDADAFRDISLTHQIGCADEASPWCTLEHPSMAFAFGKYPGTMTLAYFVGQGSDIPAVRFETRERPRNVTFVDVLMRLKMLEEMGLEENVSLLSSNHALLSTWPALLASDLYVIVIY